MANEKCSGAPRAAVALFWPAMFSPPFFSLEIELQIGALHDFDGSSAAPKD
jgi:hypothetical protein